MKHVFRKPTAEEQERHRRMREAAEAERPDVVARERERMRFRRLAMEARKLLDTAERQGMNAEQLQPLREAVEDAEQSL